jgi:hypothetical protein
MAVDSPLHGFLAVTCIVTTYMPWSYALWLEAAGGCFLRPQPTGACEPFDFVVSHFACIGTWGF